MANKKMTQLRALEIAADLISMEVDRMDEEVDDEVVEAGEIIAGMIALKKQPKNRPVDPLTANFRDFLIKILQTAEGPLTNKQLQEQMQKYVDDGELALPDDKNGNAVTAVSPQKVANNLRVFEKSGQVLRIRAEKASDKDTFVIA